MAGTHFSQPCKHELELDGEMWIVKYQGTEVMRGSMEEIECWLDQQDNNHDDHS